MSPLRDTQASIAAALDGRDGTAAALIFANGIAEDVRLAVYENNAWCAFRNTLALEFPAVARLGGDEWFRGAAREYRRRFPSRAGNLHHVGARFAAFLAEVLVDSGYEVIADVAALEWAVQEVQVAAPAQRLDVSLLAGIAPASIGELRFSLAPDCRLVESAYPVVDVWAAQRDAGAEPPPVDLGAGGQRVLVRRHGFEVECRRLAAGDYAFLAALAADAPLADAAAAAFDADPDFDLSGALQRYVALAALTSPRPPN